MSADVVGVRRAQRVLTLRVSRLLACCCPAALLWAAHLYQRETALERAEELQTAVLRSEMICPDKPEAAVQCRNYETREQSSGYAKCAALSRPKMLALLVVLDAQK